MTNRIKFDLALKKKCMHKGPCPVEDECPVCNRPVRAHEDAWRSMETTNGLVAAANYCGAECEQLAQQWSEDVASVLRRRKVGGKG